VFLFFAGVARGHLFPERALSNWKFSARIDKDELLNVRMLLCYFAGEILNIASIESRNVAS
jgi:hypothetical protein